jgi:hypothetical protein
MGRRAGLDETTKKKFLPPPGVEQIRFIINAVKIGSFNKWTITT